MCVHAENKHTVINCLRSFAMSCALMSVTTLGSAFTLSLFLCENFGHAEEWCVSGADIPNAGVLERPFTVAPATNGNQIIVSVRVQIVATHPWVGDLSARLIHPSGVTILLLDRPGIPSQGYPGPWGCGGDGLDLWLSDDGTLAAESICPFGQNPVLAGTLRPSSPLSALVGLAPQGNWKLIIQDAVIGDSGILTRACVEIMIASDCNQNGISDSIDIASGTSLDINSNGVPDECGCIADIEPNGYIDGADLSRMLSRWGRCDACSEDLTGDGNVAADDLAVLIAQWGVCGQQ